MTHREFIREIPVADALTAQEQVHFEELQRLIRDYTITKTVFEATNIYNCALEEAFGTQSTDEQEAAYQLAEDNYDVAIKALITFRYTDCGKVARAHAEFIGKDHELVSTACNYAAEGWAKYDAKGKGL